MSKDAEKVMNDTLEIEIESGTLTAQQAASVREQLAELETVYGWQLGMAIMEARKQ